jgi:hypothetical protein
MTDGYTLVPTVPDVEVYLRLRSGAGLSRRSPAQAAPALAGTWWGCHVVHDGTGEAAAMGRVIGDGGWYGCAEDREGSMGMSVWLRS